MMYDVEHLTRLTAEQLWIGPLGDLSTHEHKNYVLETD